MNDRRHPVLTIDGRDSTPEDWSVLEEQILKHLRENQFSEVWISFGQSRAMSMIVNGSRACLMFLLNQDEECFHTLDPAFDGHHDVTLDFILANGQRDRYPARWTIDVTVALEGMRHFFETRDRSQLLTWIDE